MGYRDDREGLRQKAEALEDELREMKARLEAHEGKDVEDERRIAELTSKLEVIEEEKRKQRAQKAAPKSPKKKPGHEANAGEEKLTEAEKEASRNAMMPLVFTFGVGGVLLLVVLLAGSAKDPAGTMSSPRNDKHPTTNQSDPATAVSTRSGEIKFQGEVLEATGINLAKGTHCDLTAEISSTGVNRNVGKVVVICGTELLYVRGQHNGEPIMSNYTWEFWEVAADASDGPHKYRLLFEDKGTRSSKLFQIFADTRVPKLRLWRDEPDRATVDVKIAEWSEGRRGEALLR